MNTNTQDRFPEVYASTTQSKFGSASIFTKESSFSPFDATAPNMTPQKSLARAQHAAMAINEYEALCEVAESHNELRACVAALLAAHETSDNQKDFADSIDRWIQSARIFHGNAKIAYANLAAIRGK